MSDFVGNSELVAKVTHWISIQDVPNLLLYGPSGTGKTSISKIIANSLDADVYYINASSENGIDVLRDKIQTIVNTTSFSEWKIVILDEADGLTVNFQQAMRPLLEVGGKTRFIFTANYPEKIIPALHSRLTKFVVEPPSKTAVCVRVKYIVDTENITYQPEDIVTVVSQYYPDQRKIIDTVQRNSITGALVLSKNVQDSIDYCSEILEHLQSKNDIKSTFNAIRQIIANSKIKHFEHLIRFLFDNLDSFAPDGKKSSVIYHLSEAQYRVAIVATDPEIQIANMFVNILTDIKS